MAIIGNRYTLDQILKQLPEATLHQGTDLTFNRSVLIYTYGEIDRSKQEEALRWLNKASRVTGVRFMHMLDVGTDDGILYVVLQAETGALLSERLKELSITSRQALQHMHELALAIREARVERMPECSLDADNLWIDRNGRLRILNFWTEGKIGRRSVPGLALLLYQLAARTEVPTASIREYSYEINGMLADLPDETRITAVALACKAYEGGITLSGLQRGLAILLGNGGESAKPPHAPASIGSERIMPRIEEEGGGEQVRELMKSTGNVAKKLTSLRDSFQWRRRHSFLVAAIGLLVLLIWLVWQPPSNGSPAAGPLPSRHPSPEPAPTSSGLSTSGQTSASIRPMPFVAPSATPLAQPSASAHSPSASPSKLPNPEGLVPDMTGHKLEEAEQMAIAAGLRYQYFLESNGATQGTVFKQDLAPGTPVKKGESITLWVSKGK